jgi:hypothetical protein
MTPMATTTIEQGIVWRIMCTLWRALRPKIVIVHSFAAIVERC